MPDLTDAELVMLCQRLGALRAAAPGPQWVAYPAPADNRIPWGLVIHLPRSGGTPQDAAAYLEELLAAEPVLTAAVLRLRAELASARRMAEGLTLSGTDPRYLEYLRRQREQGPPPGPPHP